MTAQNEPDANTSNYPGAVWAAADLRTFYDSYLGPAMNAAGSTSKLLAGDAGGFDKAATFLGPGLGSSYVAGSAIHAYSGTADQFGTVIASYPTKEAHMTEMSWQALTGHAWPGKSTQSASSQMGEMAGDCLIGAIRNGA